MRIVGPLRDYYDVGASWDTDPRPLYVREPWTTDLIATSGGGWQVHEGDPRGLAVGPFIDRWRGDRWGWGHPWWSDLFETSWLGFCGSVRRVFLVGEEAHLDHDSLASALRALPTWGHGWRDEAHLESALERLGTEPDLALAVEGPADLGAPEPTMADLFRALETPVFLLRLTNRRTARLLGNPCLRDLGIHRLLDPWTAWQRIETYLSNELARQVDPPAPIDDGLRRDIHGFDDRSFKQDPGGPGRKRKRRSQE